MSLYSVAASAEPDYDSVLQDIVSADEDTLTHYIARVLQINNTRTDDGERESPLSMMWLMLVVGGGPLLGVVGCTVVVVTCIVCCRKYSKHKK